MLDAGFAGLNCWFTAGAFTGVGKLSSSGQPLVPAQIGRILLRLDFLGKLLFSDQAWVAA